MVTNVPSCGGKIAITVVMATAMNIIIFSSLATPAMMLVIIKCHGKSIRGEKGLFMFKDDSACLPS